MASAGTTEMEGASRSDRRPEERTLDRVSAASLDQGQFLERYFYPGRPVVLTDAIGDWPARQWDPEALRQLLGDREVEVRVSDSGLLFDNRSGDSRTERMSFRALVDRLEAGEGGPRLYFAQQDLRALLPDHRRYVRPFRYLRRTDYLKDVNLWFGDRGCVTPLHFDFLHNFFAQIHGRKEFVIFGPDDRPYLYPNVSRPLFYFVSQVDVLRPDWEAFPEFRRATPYRFVLGPGDSLFLPCGWWHCVRTCDVSISVNQWWTRMFSRNTRQLRLAAEFVGALLRAKLGRRIPGASAAPAGVPYR